MKHLKKLFLILIIITLFMLIYSVMSPNVDVYTKTEIDTKLTGMVKVQKLTQAEYDALETKDENVLYAIIEPATAG